MQACISDTRLLLPTCADILSCWTLLNCCMGMHGVTVKISRKDKPQTTRLKAAAIYNGLASSPVTAIGTFRHPQGWSRVCWRPFLWQLDFKMMSVFITMQSDGYYVPPASKLAAMLLRIALPRWGYGVVSVVLSRGLKRLLCGFISFQFWHFWPLVSSFPFNLFLNIIISFHLGPWPLVASFPFIGILIVAFCILFSCRFISSPFMPLFPFILPPCPL